MSKNLFVVKRSVPRFPFVAQAEVVAVGDGKRFVASISELSAKGCYLETLERLAVGAELLLLVRHGGSECDLVGKAIYQREGKGMGVAFDEMAVEQRYILASWLAELARKQPDAYGTN